MRRRPRRHRQPLLLVVAADDPHGRPRHQGRRGRRLHRRRRRDREPLHERHVRRPARHHQPACSPPPRPAPPSAAQGGAGSLGPARGPARHLHRHGPDRRERGRVREASPRERRTSSPPCPSSGPEPRRSGLLRARDHPGHPRPTAPSVSKDDGIRAGTTDEKLAELKPVFRPDGTVTAGNACPLNDGAAAVIVMSDTKAGRARPHPARPHRLLRRHRASTPRSWASAPSRPAAGHGPGRHDHRRHRPGRDQRGLRRPGHPVGQAPRHRAGTSST